MNTAVKKSDNIKKVSAVIVAAGSSSRMHGIDKQLLDIGGKPVIARAVSAFQKSEVINEIVIVTREDLIPQIKKLVSENGFSKVKSVVKGADTRQKSVFNGISATSETCEYVAIHDGARPFVTQEIIKNTVDAAIKYGAASAAQAAKDTVKIVEDNGKIIKTVNRDAVRLMQTPQVFEKNTYLSAMKSVPNSEMFTDDCVLMEKFGRPVYCVEASPLNLKITTREDIIFAEAIIRSEEK